MGLPVPRSEIGLYQDIAAGEGLRLFPIIGDSMQPTLYRGDFALVRPVDGYDGEGCYVLGSPVGPSLYRVECFGGQARLMSDNPRYSTWEITRAEFDADVLAKAVFRVNVMDRRHVPEGLRF